MVGLRSRDDQMNRLSAVPAMPLFNFEFLIQNEFVQTVELEFDTLQIAHYEALHTLVDLAPALFSSEGDSANITATISAGSLELSRISVSLVINPPPLTH